MTPTMPLSHALVGQTLTYMGINGHEHGHEHGHHEHGGGRQGDILMHRLAELGLTPGMRLEVINRSPGPFIVQVRGTRLVLGRGMVERIVVRPVMEEQ
jgi:Fe2+ transport system protein FeoA